MERRKATVWVDIWKSALLSVAKAKDPLWKLCYTLNWTEVNRRRCNTQWKTFSFFLFSLLPSACVCLRIFRILALLLLFSGFTGAFSQFSGIYHQSFCVHLCIDVLYFALLSLVRFGLAWLGVVLSKIR